MLFLHSVYRGHHYGDIALGNDLEFHGWVHGSVTVASGRQLFLRGRIAGDLIVEKDGIAAVHGTITGTVLNHGAHVFVWGLARNVRDTGHRRTHVNHRTPARRINDAASLATPGTQAYGQLMAQPPERRDPVLSSGNAGARAGWASWITD